MGSIETPRQETHDVLIIGAGLSGVCALYHVRERFPSWNVGLLEAGTDVGGTWYWNRYPGARFDSESISYAFSWDKELLQDWHWKEAFSPQPETLKYIQLVADKHNLRKDIKFGVRVKSATWNEADNTWVFLDESGNSHKTTFFISCLGFLSAPTLPRIPGIDKFHGEKFHTSRWPHDFIMSRDFAGKQIGVVGTGATGIQAITEIAKEPTIRSLHVFQRTANWSAPLRNTEITSEQMAYYRSEYDSIFQRCAQTPMCFIHEADPRKSSDVTDEERMQLWESIYGQPGFGKWLGAFRDTYVDREANKLYSDFMENKIRQRVHDPTVAEKLIPKSHGFGTRRVPLESGYFEAYNKPNIHLVDLQETPIDKITPSGISTSDGTDYELDVMVFATGFDAITGAFNAIDWHAKDGRPLVGSSDTEKGQDAIWIDHKPKTFLGITAPAMPNMFMVLGPHQPFGNATRSIEHAVLVICELLQYCKDNHYRHVEPTQEAVDEWTEHVHECAKGALSNEVDSWMTGVNKNVAGKTTRSVARYAGSAIEFRRRCEECRASGWKGLVFS
ncbi:uncharacterized protein A1O9_05112 [Exophiala aquamarina CBS 119918]|uniref:Cyclohexanone monooxygenase n=1 Tax=Exophiala aquamarina CBS 119918 TaxID=1182545 RepID=A0A072PKM6_9EURO|nr:uncharacterized protein A1O9_05112 [Exophiala aquamarina CBS 119918]KEF60262.1 hypothetical protein A1O9_05112 [Exophiala aquamarina CBS 119918]